MAAAGVGLELKEPALSCLGCLSFFCESGSAAVLACDGLDTIALAISAALAALEVPDAGIADPDANPDAGVDAGAGAGAAPAAPATPTTAGPRPPSSGSVMMLVAATDLLKNLMLVPEARPALLAIDGLAERLMTAISNAAVGETARTNALKTLRMVAAGVSDDFSLRSELDARGFETAIQKCIALESGKSLSKPPSASIAAMAPAATTMSAFKGFAETLRCIVAPARPTTTTTATALIGT